MRTLSCRIGLHDFNFFYDGERCFGTRWDVAIRAIKCRNCGRVEVDLIDWRVHDPDDRSQGMIELFRDRMVGAK